MKQKRKMKTLKHIYCPYCGAPAVIRPASEIYKDASRTDSLYVCRNYPRCNAYVGMYQDTGKPFGPLANGELRHLRIRAHRAFDRLWMDGLMSRKSAYHWMADFFGLGLRDAHIGSFGEYRCRQLIAKCEELLAQKKTA